MPVNLKQNNLKYKDPQTGLYKSIDVVGEQLTFDAEAYATGYRNGVEITDSNDGAYQNNARYYKDLAETAASTFIIDNTLTKTGQPADAKKTGDEIINLKNSLVSSSTNFVAGKFYNAGDSIFYEGKLYSRKESGADNDWDISKWRVFNVGSSINNINTSLSEGLASRPTSFQIETWITNERNARGMAISNIENSLNAEIRRAKEEENKLNQLFTKDVTDAVDTWIENNPDKIIALQDHSVGSNKIAYNALNYVTPEMFKTSDNDDSDAITAASLVGPVFCGSNTYYIDKITYIHNNLLFGNFVFGVNGSIAAIGIDNIRVEGCSFYLNEFPELNSDNRGKWLLVLQRCNGAIVSRCSFTHGVSSLYIDRCITAIVSNNIFKDMRQTSPRGNGYGVLLIESKSVLINANIFYDVARHAIYVSHDSTSTYNENIDISNNIFYHSEDNSGDDTGFEVPINVRPAKKVIIRNNYFENMFNIATFNRQDISLGDETRGFVGSEDIYITKNIGKFKYTTRRDGVIFFSSSSDTELYPSTKNIIIDGNIVECEYGHFISADNFENLIIVNNKVKFTETTLQAIVMVKMKRKDLLKDLYIKDNIFELNDGFLFNVDDFNPDVIERTDYGNFEIINNKITGIRCIGRWNGRTQSLAAGVNSFNDVVIINNIFDFTHPRDYFSSPKIKRLYLNGNIANTTHGLYIGQPDHQFSTDPIFTHYSAKGSNPGDAIPGSINIFYTDNNNNNNNNRTYIKTYNGWKQIVL